MEKFTFVIALFTVIYSVVTIGLYLIAKNTLVVSQRAFVYAEKANILGSQTIGGISRPPNAPILLDIAFKNSGSTVATNSTATIGYLLNRDGIPLGFGWPIKTTTQPVLLAPQQETHITLPISETDLNDIKIGKTNLFVYGQESYQDVFGTWHKTEYCFQYFGYSLKATGELEEYIFWTGPQHNCADDDCHE